MRPLLFRYLFIDKCFVYTGLNHEQEIHSAQIKSKRWMIIVIVHYFPMIVLQMT